MIDHPAIVKILHVDLSDDGLPFQVQELVEGETLERRLRRGEPWQPAVAARLVGTLASAVACAHARGIVHRDVKPANVMLTAASPGLKLLDFGIAKLRDEELGEGLTATGAILGTPVYMGPEQIEGAGVTDRADIYALGVTLFLLLTGKYPFDTSTPRASLVDRLMHDAPDARSSEPDVPPPLAELVQRCLSRDPAERPAAFELGEALREFADRRSVPAVDVLERSRRAYDARATASALTRTFHDRSRVTR